MDTALVTVLSGAGACGVFCILFVTGWVFPRSVVNDLKAEIAELKRDRDNRIAVSEASMAAAIATRDVLAAIQQGKPAETGHGS